MHIRKTICKMTSSATSLRRQLSHCYDVGMRLIKAWTGDPDRTYELFGKFQADEHGFVNDAYGMNRSEFDRYMHTVEDMHHGRNLPSGYVPATKYILVNDDGEYVGIFNLRHRLNDGLRNGAGHIGYGIAPEYRGRGYATEGLRMILAIALHEHGIMEAYLSLDKDNPASLAVQRHCGARIDHENDTEYFTRITITNIVQ